MCMSFTDVSLYRQEGIYADSIAYTLKLSPTSIHKKTWERKITHMAAILVEAYEAMNTADIKARSAELGTRPTDRYVPTWQPVADLVDAELTRRIGDVADVIALATPVAAVAA